MQSLRRSDSCWDPSWNLLFFGGNLISSSLARRFSDKTRSNPTDSLSLGNNFAPLDLLCLASSPLECRGLLAFLHFSKVQRACYTRLDGSVRDLGRTVASGSSPNPLECRGIRLYFVGMSTPSGFILLETTETCSPLLHPSGSVFSPMKSWERRGRRAEKIRVRCGLQNGHRVVDHKCH